MLDLDSQFRYQETRGLKKIKGKGKNPRVARSKKIIKKELKKTGPVNGSARALGEKKNYLPAAQVYAAQRQCAL